MVASLTGAADGVGEGSNQVTEEQQYEVLTQQALEAMEVVKD